MNIFKEARQSELNNTGYKVRRFFLIWRNKIISWSYFYFEYGIRWSDVWQVFPIWNISHNNQRAIMFGFWKLHFTIGYYRKKSVNQQRWQYARLKKVYQLLF